MATSRAFWLFPAAFAIGGCTNDVVQDDAPDSSASELTAIASIEGVTYADAKYPPHATAVARFVRTMEGPLDPPTMAMLGATIDLPDRGTCASLPPIAGVARAVALVDLGATSITSNGSVKWLVPRRVPDIDDLVSGVVYSLRSEGEDAVPAGALALFAAGTESVGPITLDVGAIEAPTDVRFDGSPFDPFVPVAAVPGADVVVTWATVVTPELVARDIVYFEIEGGGGEPLVCAYDDTGSATLPASLFARSGGTLTIHRLRRVPIEARGIDEGQARLDLAIVYPLVPTERALALDLPEKAVDLSP